MGLGSTAKKVQKLADVAEDTYKRINELKAQLEDLRGTVEETGDRVETLERELDQQRALVEAIAEERGIDPESVLADAAIDDAEAPVDDGSESDAPGADASDPSSAEN